MNYCDSEAGVYHCLFEQLVDFGLSAIVIAIIIFLVGWLLLQPVLGLVNLLSGKRNRTTKPQKPQRSQSAADKLQESVTAWVDNLEEDDAYDDYNAEAYWSDDEEKQKYYDEAYTEGFNRGYEEGKCIRMAAIAQDEEDEAIVQNLRSRYLAFNQAQEWETQCYRFSLDSPYQSLEDIE